MSDFMIDAAKDEALKLLRAQVTADKEKIAELKKGREADHKAKIVAADLIESKAREIDELTALVERKDASITELLGTHGDRCQHYSSCEAIKNGRAALSLTGKSALTEVKAEKIAIEEEAARILVRAETAEKALSEQIDLNNKKMISLKVGIGQAMTNFINELKTALRTEPTRSQGEKG